MRADGAASCSRATRNQRKAESDPETAIDIGRRMWSYRIDPRLSPDKKKAGDLTGSVAIIWSLTFVVGLGHFAHCIATSGEILTAVLSHQLPAAAYLRWLLPATCGNITGGVLLVTLLEYGQAKLD